jgi:Ribonuclease-III-like
MTGMQTAPYQEFAREKFGFEFKNIEYLITALTHRSYVNEHKKSVSEHNERLEFLGDAVLELVVTDFLFRNYTEQEGILTRVKVKRMVARVPVSKFLPMRSRQLSVLFILSVDMRMRRRLLKITFSLSSIRF